MTPIEERRHREAHDIIAQAWATARATGLTGRARYEAYDTEVERLTATWRAQAFMDYCLTQGSAA